MKKHIIFFLALVLAAGLFAQNERIKDPRFFRTSELLSFIYNEPVYEDVFKDPDDPDKEIATEAAWSAFTKAYGIESLPHGMISTVFQPQALEKIDVAMGNIGNSLALIQIANDFYMGNTLNATSNAVKTSMFYAISQWGWRSLQIAGVGLQVFDYMLTTVGEAAVTARKQALWDAYFDYYYKGMGKRDLRQWKEILSSMRTSEEVEEEINNYLEAFFHADGLDKKLTRGWHTEAEIKSVKAEYLQTYLLPYLKPLFAKLKDEAYDKELEFIKELYIETALKLNKYNKYRFQIEAPYEYYPMCQCGIQVMSNGNTKIFVKGKASDLGVCDLQFTKYSVLVNNITKARAVLRVNTPNGPRMFYQPVDLKKDQSFINFSLTEEDIKKDESEETPEETSSLELGNTINAVFVTNGKTLNVKIGKVRESKTEYTGKMVHRKIPEKNTLTINKITREMNFVYKLKGLFAPELICRGLPVAPNTYKGIIETNNAEKVKVGTFTLILNEK
ncbi:MAG: hypothetical protein U5N56_07525 [Candidatus Marinimicrobia bacterium]|nr:hypothetical protein [Candidatus Neomarinimicrobiota bacterium]